MVINSAAGPNAVVNAIRKWATATPEERAVMVEEADADRAARIADLLVWLAANPVSRCPTCAQPWRCD